MSLPPPLASSYSPSDLVDWLHNRDRFGRTNDITADGGIDLKDSSHAYNEGVGAYFFVFLVIAIFFTLLFVVLYFCACCRCCCFRRKRSSGGAHLDQKDDAETETKSCRKRSFVMLTVLLLVLAAVSMYFVSEMTTGAADAADGVQAGLDLVDDIDGLNRDLEAQLQIALTNANQWNTAEPGATASLISALNDAISQSTSVSQSTEDITDDLDSTSDDSKDAADAANLVGWIYVALVFVWAAMVLVSLYLCTTCRCWFKTLMFLVLPLVLFTWIVTGVIFTGALVASDICIDPDNIIVELSDAQPPFASNSDFEASLYYYVHCDVNAIADSGLVVLVDDAATELQDAIAQAASLVGATNPGTQGFYDAIVTALGAADLIMTDTDGMTDKVSCDSVNAVYRSVRGNLCSDTLDSMIQLWGAQLVSCTLLLVAVFVALPFWNNKEASKEERQAQMLDMQRQGVTGVSPQAPKSGQGVSLV